MKKSRKYISMILALLLALSLTACGGGSSGGGGGTQDTPPAGGDTGNDDTEYVYLSDDGEFKIAKGDWVIGVSNSYFGNQWRKSMIECFERTAAECKEQGIIGDYIVQNGDNTVNNQIAQINTFIMQGVDAILLDAASPTALNAVLQEAANAGIVIVAFDGITEGNNVVHNIDYDFEAFGRERVEKSIELCGTDELNVIVVHGMEGTAPDIGMYAGSMEAIEEHPNINVLATIWGEFSATKTQEELLKVIPSLNVHVDAVITQCGGDSYGAVQAFEAYYEPDEMPIILGDNGAEYINWLAEYQKDHPDYLVNSGGTAPSSIQEALWCALYVLNGGENLPLEMITPIAAISPEELPTWAGKLAAGSVWSPDYDPIWTYENIIKPFQ